MAFTSSRDYGFIIETKHFDYGLIILGAAISGNEHHYASIHSVNIISCSGDTMQRLPIKHSL